MTSATAPAGDAFRHALATHQHIQHTERADPRLNPETHSVLLHHDQPTPRAIVMLHGITSSPVQFRQLGELFFQDGYNVLIPRMPFHGFVDRLTTTPERLTPAAQTTWANDAVDLGRGLGTHLTLMGLSVAGVLAAWCATERADLDRAVLLAPSFAPRGVPQPLVPLLSNIALRLPNLNIWWDPRVRARLGPATSYPRFATHALASSFQVGVEVSRRLPRAQQVIGVVNAHDPAVNNALTRRLLGRWHAPVHTLKLGTLHDFIGPYQPGARTDVVYPFLLELANA